MAAQIIDGKKVSQQIKEELKERDQGTCRSSMGSPRVWRWFWWERTRPPPYMCATRERPPGSGHSCPVSITSPLPVPKRSYWT